MTFYFVRTNLREFYVEAAGIGAALEAAMQLCIGKIEWILECQKSEAVTLQVAA